MDVVNPNGVKHTPFFFHPNTQIEMFTVRASLLIISGAAALIYQVVWVRVLGFSLGATSVAVSTVIAAFFLGLASGSYFAGRLAEGRNNDLKVYILLEIVVGVSGLLLLPALLNLDLVMSLLPQWGTELWARFLMAVALLIVPTFCMGATFPVMASILLRSQLALGSQFSLLYGLNTLGAVIGAFTTGFLLIPYLGLDRAVYVACSFNFFAAILALSMDRRQRCCKQVQMGSDTVAACFTDNTGSSSLASAALFVTGMVALGHEVAWTTYLALFAGSTIYGFTAILTIFLIGITAGSWAMNRLMKRISFRFWWFVFGILLLAASLLAVRLALGLIPGILNTVNELDVSTMSYHVIKYGVVLAILFVPTLMFGALFPLTMLIYCKDVKHLQKRVGTGYAINTVGSIVGVIAVGLWLIPTIGTDAVLQLMILVMVALALLFVPSLSAWGDKTTALVCCTSILIAGLLLPGIDYREMLAAQAYRLDRITVAGEEPEFLYLREGKSNVISMVTYNGKMAYLQSNGMQESFIALDGSGSPPKAEMLLGLVPYFLHDDPQSAFVVGFGGGHTVRSLSMTTVESIRVVELEKGIVDAVRSVTPPENSLFNDARVNIVFNDARNTLLVEQQYYDIIASQPSHPWLSGAGSLFTQDFFEIVKLRLNEGGIYAQWVNLFNMDTTTLKSILRAYFEVFPYGFVMAQVTTGDLLLFGSGTPLFFDMKSIRSRMLQPEISRTLSQWGIDAPEAILGFFSLSRDQALQASADVYANTDTRILTEVRLAGMMTNPEGEENPYRWLGQLESLDIVPYLLEKHAAEVLYNSALYFLKWDSVRRFAMTYGRLMEVDPSVAAKLRKVLPYE